MASDYFGVDSFVSGTATSTGAGLVNKSVRIPTGMLPVWVLISSPSAKTGFKILYNEAALWLNCTLPENYPFPLPLGNKDPGGIIRFYGFIANSTEFTITIGCKAVLPCP